MSIQNNFLLSEQNTSSCKFDSIACKWFELLKPQLKESSIVKYTNILNLHLLPEFSTLEITEISRNNVSTFINKLLVSGGQKDTGLSPKTVTDILSVLKSIFRYATQEKNLPVADIKGISVKKQQKPMRILSRIEQITLSHYLCSQLTLCNLGILLCLYTGLRIGELCALKWEDISFREQSLHVHQTMQRIQTFKNGEKDTYVKISTPKSDCSIRKIPIPEEIFQLIKGSEKPADTFFLTGLPDIYIEPRTMQNRFKYVIKQCNLNDTNFHALRHTFATRCIELGFDIKCLSEILGHANVNITLNRYVHPSMELKQKNMNMLSDLFLIE